MHFMNFRLYTLYTLFTLYTFHFTHFHTFKLISYLCSPIQLDFVFEDNPSELDCDF